MSGIVPTADDLRAVAAEYGVPAPDDDAALAHQWRLAQARALIRAFKARNL